jgi:hypothetical protein
MLNVYQIQLSDKETAGINRVGWDFSEKTKAFAGRSFVKPYAVKIDFYDMVATVDTDDLEEAFELMNLWEQPERVSKLLRCSSMSVGDIVETENGDRYLCASFGFEKIC